VPLINSSNEADASDFFFTTLPIQPAEKGYYVFPVNMVKRTMEADGLADAGLVHSADPKRLGALFNADTILYVEIQKWESNYNVLSASTTVSFRYNLKSAKTGASVWLNEATHTLASSSSSGNIFADLIVTAISGAINSMRSDYTPIANMANTIALSTEGRGIPSGPYSPLFGSEADVKAYPATGSGWVGGPEPESASAVAETASEVKSKESSDR
ncbi:MAG: DUF799 family lipoprotein, partial [Kordiimonadaceae bacterium]|nr:DUF799 family lipoprotein [Kordiimonadaceae bacterium]